jgi:microcystin-dependent protein
MPSPVDETNFAPLTNQATVCQRLGALINGYNAMFEFFEWFLNDQKEISDAALEGIADRMTPIGTILLWGSEMMPSDKWLLCNGQHYAKADYLTLSARLGPNFGLVEGDTSSSRFRVPDLMDRFPMGAGKAYTVGKTGGLVEVTLTEDQMPSHTHTISGTFAAAGNDDGSGGVDAGDFGSTRSISDKPLVLDLTIGETGGDKPHENIPPYLALRYIIKAL